MDSFELNKVLGAVLGTCLFLLSLNIAAGALFSAHKPEKPGYDIAIPEKAPGGQQQAPVADEPIEKLLVTASVERGENSGKKCLACHTFKKGEPNRVGPNLWGVVGRAHASVADFKYSPAMKAMTGNWSIAELNKFLSKPTGMVPGTSMTFIGLPRANERADVIAYLNTLSDNPAPLPKAAEAPASAPKADASAPAPKAH